MRWCPFCYVKNNYFNNAPLCVRHNYFYLHLFEFQSQNPIFVFDSQSVKVITSSLYLNVITIECNYRARVINTRDDWIVVGQTGKLKSIFRFTAMFDSSCMFLGSTYERGISSCFEFIF